VSNPEQAETQEQAQVVSGGRWVRSSDELSAKESWRQTGGENWEDAVPGCSGALGRQKRQRLRRDEGKL